MSKDEERFKSFTLPVYLTKKQKELAWNIIGSCFYAANSYISHTNYMHSKGENRLSHVEFNKYYNKCKHYTYEEIDSLEDEWEKKFALGLKERSCYRDTKAVSKALKQVAISYKTIYNLNKKLEKGEKPHCIHYRNYRHNKRASYYFVKDSLTDIRYIDNNHIRIPCLDIVKILHIGNYYNIIPHISSGQISIDHGKWFIMFRYKDYNVYHIKHKKYGLGIDYGVNSLLTISKTDINQEKASYYGTLKGFKKDKKYIKMNNRYKALQRAINHKHEVNYSKLLNAFLDTYKREPNENEKKQLLSLSYKSNRIMKLQNKAHKQMVHISNYRDDYLKKCAYNLVVTERPSFIKIEDLHVKDMVDNKKLNYKNKDKEYITHKSHKNMQEISPYKFKTYLLNKCNDYNTILMLVDKYYPSTQTCSSCGYIKQGEEKLMKNKRIYVCPSCGLRTDRDINASLNIALTQTYEIISA